MKVMSDESLETRVSVHEAVCAQRYESIQNRLDDGSKRMSRIEYLLYITIAAVFLGPGVAALFAKKLLGM
jgi:cell division protein FtsL